MINTENEVWFIRHANSMFNLWANWTKGIIKDSDLSSDELFFVKSITGKFDVKLLDVDLTLLGTQQATAAQKVMDSIPIKYVITSPLKRTLETTRIIFSTHPLKERMRIVVNPLIRECITDMGDIPNWTLRELKEKYEVESGLNFDFGMLEEIHPGLYFLDTLEPELRETVMKQLETLGEDKYPETMSEIMEKKWKSMSKHYRGLESYANARRRAKQFLDWLKRFISEKGLRLEEVAVVTHSNFIRSLAAKEFNEYKKPIYPIKGNAEPFQININELIQQY